MQKFLFLHLTHIYFTSLLPLLPDRLSLLPLIIIITIIISYIPPPSFPALSLSQRFLQTSKSPQNSGGKRLRCRDSSEKARERVLWRRKGRLSHSRERKREDKMKEEKNEERNCWWYSCTPLRGSSTLCPQWRTHSFSTMQQCLLKAALCPFLWFHGCLLEEAKGEWTHKNRRFESLAKCSSFNISL